MMERKDQLGLKMKINSRNRVYNGLTLGLETNKEKREMFRKTNFHRHEV